jgi:hypothetical protein
LTNIASSMRRRAVNTAYATPCAARAAERRIATEILAHDVGFAVSEKIHQDRA